MVTDAVGFAAGFVARQRELEVVREAMSRGGAVVVVEGEAGIGKTRLVDEAAAALPDRPVLVGCCEPFRNPFPLGPLVEAFRSERSLLTGASLSPVTGALRPLLPELSDLLPPLPPSVGDASADRHRVYRALAELVSVLGVALVVEDVHWADEQTAEFLSYLAREVAAPSCLVITFRTEDLDRESGLLARLHGGSARPRLVQVRLEPLTQAQVGEMVNVVLGSDAVSEEFVAFLRERSDGIPFAIEELLRLLIERQDIVCEDGVWLRRNLPGLEVPAAIREAILERLARLRPLARLVVEAAAIAGAAVSPEELLRIACLEGPTGPDLVREAVTSSLLVEDDHGRIAFRHSLALSAVEASIPVHIRRQMHARAADCVEDPAGQGLGRLVRHHKESGQLEAWARSAEEAADRAVSLFDDETACHFLFDVVSERSLPLRTRTRAMSKLCTPALSARAHVRATAEVEAMLEEELPRRVSGELRVDLGFLLDQAGEAARARREWRTGIEQLDSTGKGAVAAMRSLALPWTIDGDVEEHLLWLDRAGHAIRGVAEERSRVALLADRASTLGCIADPGSRDAIRSFLSYEVSSTSARSLARGLSNLAQGSLWLGRVHEARGYIARGRAICDDYSDTRSSAALDSAALLVDWMSGRWGGLLERARAFAAAAPVPHTAVDARFVMLSLRLAYGEDVTRAEVEDLFAVALEVGSIPIAVAAAASSAAVDLRAGTPDAALESAVAGISVPLRKGAWPWAAPALPPAVDALVALGRRDAAAGLVARVRAGLRGRLEVPLAAAALAWADARVMLAAGEVDSAATGFDDAQRAWLSLPAPHLAACAGARAAEVLLVAGCPDGATRLTHALLGFERLGAARDAAWARRVLRAHGVKVPRPGRSGRRGYGNQLSPREREVAALAARGATDSEIAARLFLSPKTVENHLSRARHKLGAASRRELAGLLEKG